MGTKLSHYWLASGYLLTALIGCGGTGTTMTGSTNGAITGKVDGETEGSAKTGASGSSGATVTAWKVGATGGLEAAFSGSAKSDASGRYTLDFDAAPAAGQVLLLRADKAMGGGTVIFDGALSLAATAKAAPITRESTLEANVLLGALAKGPLPAGIDVQAVRAAVDGKMTAAIALAADQKVAVAAATSIAVSQTLAFRGMLTSASQGGSKAQVDALLKSTVTAQATLDASLDAAASAAAANAAIDAYQKAVIDAQGSAGLTLQQIAIASAAGATASASYSASAGAGAEAALRSELALAEAVALRKSIEAQAALLGASAMAQDAVKAAGVTLEAQVTATASAGASAKANIAAALNAYSMTVVKELQGALNGAQQQAVAARVAASAQAEMALRTALAGVTAGATAEANATLTVTAIDAFSASVKSQVAIAALTAVGLDQAKAVAILDILAELAISTTASM